MNLREFTEEVDRRAAEMTTDELRTAFHSLARKVPEGDRTGFLELMNRVRQEASSSDKRTDKKERAAATAKIQDEAEIKKEYACLKKLFEEIGEGERMLQADGYEDYSSGYWDSDWVYEYEDPDGIGAAYEDGARLVERCVNDGFYQTGLEVFDLMTETEVWASDGGDDFEMGLEELMDEHIISIDAGMLKKNVLYAVYQSTPPGKRPEAFYDYITSYFFRDVKIEDVLAMGKEELADSAEFMETWIGFLAKKPGDTAGRFLCEAVLYQKSGDEIMEAARKAAGCHPSLLLAAMERFEEREDTERQLQMGKEALELVNRKYTIRSRIALKTAEAALESNDSGLAGQCREKAFESHSCPVNFLRMIAENQDPKACLEKAASMVGQIPAAVPAVYGQEENREWETNGLYENEKAQLLFLTGDFDGAMKRCSSVKEGLGWSGTFTKCGIPLFLLLLLKSDTLGEGGQYAAKTAASYMEFQVKEYRKGTAYGIKIKENQGKDTGIPDDTALFWQCFCKWKEVLGPEALTDVQAENYIKILETLIDRRVKAIVSGQHRNHYGSVAALAATLGEVKESRGEAWARNRVLLGYREQFPRHSSFHEELRRYGMPDMRKKPGRK